MLQSFTAQCHRWWRGIFSGCIMCSLDALFISFIFQFSATEWTVTTRALAVSNSPACIHMLILLHQQVWMVGHCKHGQQVTRISARALQHHLIVCVLSRFCSTWICWVIRV